MFTGLCMLLGMLDELQEHVESIDNANGEFVGYIICFWSVSNYFTADYPEHLNFYHCFLETIFM